MSTTRRTLLPTTTQRLSRAESGTDRVIRFTASTQSVARDGGIVEAAGWEIDNYRDSHPVFLWAHNPDGLPIGRAVGVTKHDDSLVIDVEFAGEEQAHPFAETVYRLFDAGYLQCCSVGFRVLEERKPTEEEQARGATWVATRTELLELSAVAVPSDPGAKATGRRLEHAVRDGILRPEDARSLRHHLGAITAWKDLADAIEREAMNKRDVQETEAAFTVQVRDPSEFTEDSFDNQEYQPDPLIVAVTGSLAEGGEVVIQGLAFPKDAWQSADDVDAWYTEHAQEAMDWTGEGGDSPAEAEPDSPPEESADEAPTKRTTAEVVADLRVLLDELEALAGREGDEDEETDDPDEDTQPPRSVDPVDDAERKAPVASPADEGLYAKLLELTTRYVGKKPNR